MAKDPEDLQSTRNDLVPRLCHYCVILEALVRLIAQKKKTIDKSIEKDRAEVGSLKTHCV